LHLGAWMFWFPWTMSDVNVSPNYDRLTHALLAWSKSHLSEERTSPSWDSACLLVQSAKDLDEYARKHLEEALAGSDDELEPLHDPLRLNMGEHRWLSADREESYSDWLAWILQGMSNSAEILQLFTLAEESKGLPVVSVGRIRREVWRQEDRTDIEVPLGERGLLVIEVKVKKPSTDLSKQLKRYQQKVSDLPVEHPLLILLGIEAPELSLDLFGFTFTGWEALCQRLRLYAKRVKGSELLRAAAVLIFCGAVEQNLLGFSASPRRFHAMATVNYLHDWRKEV
jgi:hypothetical protein